MTESTTEPTPAQKRAAMTDTELSDALTAYLDVVRYGNASNDPDVQTLAEIAEEYRRRYTRTDELWRAEMNGNADHRRQGTPD